MSAPQHFIPETLSPAPSLVDSTLSKVFWCLACILLIFRLAYTPVTDLGLFFDEAYYHFWSTHLDWGYYSKPPLVAWLIYATTHIMDSDAEWAVRLASPLLYFASAYFIYLTTIRLYNLRIACYASAIFFTMPLVSFNSLFITTDAPLLFFWSVSLWLFIKLRQGVTYSLCLALGVSLGLGLLAKYTMVIWVIGLLIYLLWQRAARQAFSIPKAMALVLPMLLILLPNILWNWQHDFISFQHTAQISKLQEDLFHPMHLLEFLGGQFLAFGPLAFYFLLRLVWSTSERNTADKFLLCLCLPLLIGMSVQALLAKANANWAAPIYVSGSILVARALLESSSTLWANRLIYLNLIIAALFYFYPQIQQALDIEPTKRNTPFHRVSGWKPLIKQINQVVDHPLEKVWLSDSRSLMSYLHFYLPEHPNQQSVNIVSFNLDGQVEHEFDLYQELKQSHYPEYIFISENPRELEGCFEEVSLIAHLQQDVYPSLERRLFLYRVKGFKGYEHCHH